MATATGLLSAERLPSGTTRSQQKWTYKENTELMHCFYLAKLDGVGYRDCLKSLWDSRNPAKSAINVNTLCCYSRNIQVSHLLTNYDLKQIQAVSEPANFEPLPGTSDENPVDALVDPEPSLAAPLDHDAPQFLHDTVINKIWRASLVKSLMSILLPCPVYQECRLQNLSKILFLMWTVV